MKDWISRVRRRILQNIIENLQPLFEERSHKEKSRIGGILAVLGLYIRMNFSIDLHSNNM